MIPSIDLLDGRIVQLQQGRKVKIWVEEEPLEFARRFSSFPETQVIDLNAAMENGNNKEIVRDLCRVVNARVGGGIRTKENAEQMFRAGAKKIIIGTKANKEFLGLLLKSFDRNRIIVALDSYNGKVSVKGWKESTEETPMERAEKLRDYCGEFLYTCIEKEGLMKGIDWQTIKRLKSICKNELSVAGGISSQREIKELNALGIKTVVGMALYTKKIGEFK
ncbi:MAG: 1-(5-phosphoribosyl)-5-((5-phosphoribosylamino)methylideneamino)imidazole-4-carboxamide isomerase [Candidatus Diapherotrites archaeon]|uniref:1-(5-phosphoribosyl)-5-((5-phosphoribosylamino)methylideneamino)imidazole-4-carboxamide isomerase n=1 Tax=Candidatus Iainarchaeum sp. TaxID=3101447 RepID=A0A2D6M0T6_9ARCH|nr:1-(5-phosphoribosyl)-5-((5-phosphoribosylamino)methylideneamino)imidazole-4-carboxamide isomerase [Candidatus Diapherotrites archaeon]|tara:strand:- start:2976 stop:3638 length:663 start_codon:yes stop_codon:yes gene_type:complete